MDLKRKRRLVTRISLFAGILIIASLVLTGCVSGMSPVGWSGVAVKNNTAFVGSKEGRLVSVNLTNNAKQFGEPLKTASTGGFGCASSSGTGGSCGGAAVAVAIYGTPAFANYITGVDASNQAVYGTLAIIAGYNGKVIAYDTISLAQVWQFPSEGNLAPIISAAVVSGDYVYFGCSDGSVYALDAARGNQQWKYTTGGEIWSSPVIDNGLLFIGSFDKKIYALDINNKGEKKWEFLTGANNISSVLVSDSIVYVSSLDRNVYAINETSGQKIWNFQGGNWFWTSPVIYQGVVFAPCLDHNVYALNAKTGEKVRQYDVQGQVASTPVVVNNQVIVASRAGKIWSIDASNTSVEPKNATIVNDVTAPLTANGDNVYINGPDNTLYSYNIGNNAVSSLVSLSSQ